MASNLTVMASKHTSTAKVVIQEWSTSDGLQPNSDGFQAYKYRQSSHTRMEYLQPNRDGFQAYKYSQSNHTRTEMFLLCLRS